MYAIYINKVNTYKYLVIITPFIKVIFIYFIVRKSKSSSKDLVLLQKLFVGSNKSVISQKLPWTLVCNPVWISTAVSTEL